MSTEHAAVCQRDEDCVLAGNALGLFLIQLAEGRGSRNSKSLNTNTLAAWICQNNVLIPKRSVRLGCSESHSFSQQPVEHPELLVSFSKTLILKHTNESCWILRTVGTA